MVFYLGIRHRSLEQWYRWSGSCSHSPRHIPHHSEQEWQGQMSNPGNTRTQILDSRYTDLHDIRCSTCLGAGGEGSTISMVLHISRGPNSPGENLRLVAVQRPVPRVSSLTMALVGGGRINARGKGMTVMKTQSAFLNVRAGGIGPNGVLLFVIKVFQLQLHLQGARRCRGLGRRTDGEGRKCHR